jgi:hypothetical protein
MIDKKGARWAGAERHRARKDVTTSFESLIAPNKQIAPGFEAATIKLKNNNVLNGVVKSESDTESRW